MSQLEDLDEAIAAHEGTLDQELILRRLLYAGIAGLLLLAPGLILLPIIVTSEFIGFAIYGVPASLVGITFLGAKLLEQRDKTLAIRREIGRLEERRKIASAGGSRSRLAILTRYKNDLPELVESFRIKARSYRRTHNLAQAVVIIGSLGSSAIISSGASGPLRWGIVGLTLVVGVTAALSGYFKLKERALNLQRTADEIEREHRAVELRLGDYNEKEPEDALHDFVIKVEVFRSNQKRQELELDQPADVQYRAPTGAE